MVTRTGPPRALVRSALDTLRSARRDRQSCAVNVGFVLMDFLERPWTFRETVRRLKEALGADYTLEAGEAPGSIDLDDPEAASAEEVQEVQRLLDEPTGLRWRLAPLLGNLFLTVFLLCKGKRRLAWTFLKPQAWRAPLVRLDRPFLPMLLPPEPPPTLAFAGPEWLARLLHPEGLLHPGGGPLLVAVAGRAGRDALREAPGPRAVWLVDGHLDADLRDLVRDGDRLFVADPRLERAAREVLGREAALLPPAVQPLLQNPFGWWGGEGPRWPGEERLPRSWHPVQDAARGLGPPGEAPGLPGWAGPDWEAEADRFLRARDALRHDALARRLAEVRRSLGLPEPERPLPLVSVLLATNRPERAVSALESVRRQRWPRLELVMVLHGPGFDLPALERALHPLAVPFRLLRADPRQTLGHCYELGARQCSGRYVAIMDDDNWFGARYLEDALLWMETSGALAGGKFTMPVFFEEDSSLHLILPDREFRRMQPSSAQAVFRRELLEVLPWRAAAAAADTMFFADCLRLGVPLATFDRFNFAYCRGPRRHSHDISKAEMLRNYRALCLGCPASPGDCDL